MFEALQIAATGMQAHQLHVDTIANNIANVNTQGFKRARVSFQDVVTAMADASLGTSPALPAMSSEKTGAGVGVSAASVLRMFDSGDLRKTESGLDIAIAGEGFIEVSLPDGSVAFTRGGALKVNGEGLLALASGPVLAGAIAVPEGTQGLTIAGDGSVQGRPPGSARTVDLGRIALVRFMSPQGLLPLGDGLYRATDGSGAPVVGRPSEDGMGTLRQGYLEGSNVKMVDEVVGLMVAQRAYEASLKVAQAADDMLAMVNNLRK